MKRLLLLIVIFCAIKVNAQNYLISFAGTGASTTVNSVKVENLSKGTSLTLNGSDILRLTIATGVKPVEDYQSNELKIYPNPMTDFTTLEIVPPIAGFAVISVCEMSGKRVAQIQTYLENFRQDFRLSGLKNGLYIINVESTGYQFSGKLLSNGKSTGKISIDKVNNVTQAVNEKTEKADSKGTQATVDMVYSTGNRLKFSGISGNFSTVKIAIPVSSSTITFNFILCRDGDNINYPVVAIGTQVWMAENLKTTKYRNGNLIGTTTPAELDISLESTPKYQWAYGGNEANVATYGRLYTFYATTDSRVVCPTGWHVPSDAEWTILSDYLTANGFSFTPGSDNIAKSMASSSGWAASAIAGDVGNDQSSNNLSGFTALPGGFRNATGAFLNIGQAGHWRSSTSSGTGTSWYRSLNYNFGTFYRNDYGSSNGYAIRCVKD